MNQLFQVDVKKLTDENLITLFANIHIDQTLSPILPELLCEIVNRNIEIKQTIIEIEAIKNQDRKLLKRLVKKGGTVVEA
jgi:hypothetical protein